MSEVWGWDPYYGVHFCCLGAVLREEHNWYFFPYRSYKLNSHKHSFGPYKTQREAEIGLYEWHIRVANFVGVLGEEEGTEIINNSK